MPSEEAKKLEFNQYQKSEKKILSTTKVSEHVPSDISVSTISSFKNTENKHAL